MTDRHYVLWLINAVQDWDKPTLLGALERASTPNLRITAELGDREAPRGAMHGIDINDHAGALQRTDAYRGITEYTPYGALMHEGGHPDRQRLTTKRPFRTFDEYFVPIPVKCLGDPEQLTQQAEALRAAQQRGGAFQPKALARIRETYTVHFADTDGPAYFTRYWDEGLTGAPTAMDGGGNEVRMHSKKYAGYYRMLIEWNQRAGHEHDRHLLLGYSQGGLVGRFLAYLDEHVFQLGLVRGVVTVQSPNFGSPVARAENAGPLELMIRGELLKVRHLMRAVQLFAPQDTKSLIRFLREHSHDITIDALDEQLAGSIREIRARMRRGETSSRSNSEELVNMFVAARKWISGLVGDRQGESFAFFDLSPARNYEEGRVLQLVNDADHGHKTMPHAAVVGCNPSVKALFGGGFIGFLADLIAGMLRISIKDLTQKYKMIFDERTRLGASPHAIYTALTNLYASKIAKRLPHVPRDVAEMAHDCVIPAAHQLMYPPFTALTTPISEAPRTFLGNWINEDSNHASGTGLKDETPNDLEYVVEIFERLPHEDRPSQRESG